MIKSLVIQIGITQQDLKLNKDTGDTGPYRFTEIVNIYGEEHGHFNGRLKRIYRDD